MAAKSHSISSNHRVSIYALVGREASRTNLRRGMFR